MSPREALGLLDQAAARFAGSREDHINLQAASAVLLALVSKDEAEEQRGKVVEGGEAPAPNAPGSDDSAEKPDASTADGQDPASK